MRRVPLTGEDSGKWFDADKATVFKENTYHDGNNFISCSTGSQWHHEWLYRTESKRWIKHTFSGYRNIPEEYFEINDEDAADWLISNSHTHADAADLIAEREL